MTQPPLPEPRRNVELKARLISLESARTVAERVATGRLETQHQIDTYFNCQHGRLKLREINGKTAQLISYQRPDRNEARQSHYLLADIPQPSQIKCMLSAALGVKQTVDKVREIFMFENVRIHLDRVEQLGDFLEFEAVLAEEDDPQLGHRQLQWLTQQFSIRPEDILAGSYGEMS